MSIRRFALHNYNGDPTEYYLIEQIDLSEDDVEVSPEVTHHIFVVDVSGSMYYEIPSMRTMLEKLLTLEEFHNSELLVTLITYSGQGEMTVHFNRSTVEQIMAPGSAEVEQIRNLHVIGLTCISQALEEARKYVADGETTCISLHSDGYANDRSPASERREIDAICSAMAEVPTVFVNTIAYSAYSDFKLLVGIANALSGKCVQAGSIKEVYDALHDTTALLAGRMAPAITSELGPADYQVFVSVSASRVNGAAADMVLRGLKPEDDKTVYRFRKVDEDTYLDSDAPVCGANASLLPVYAFSAAKLSEGHLNASKYALMATRNKDLIYSHYRALTAPALAAMYADLVSAITKNDIQWPMMTEYGLGLHRIPLLTVLGFLSKQRGIVVDLDHLYSNYTRRGLKMLTGSWAEDGTLIEPTTSTRIVGTPGIARVSSFDLNNNTATINMLCVRDVELLDNGEVVREVANVELTGDNQLRAYNNYTIVADGELNVAEVKMKFGDKSTFRQLKKWGLVDGSFDPAAFYCLDLRPLPLVDFCQPFSADGLDTVFTDLAIAKVISSMMRSLLPGRSARFTDEQIVELDKYHISSNLYYTPPSAVPYTDKKAAVAAGLIDARVSYQIDIGSTQILSRTQLHSANAFLARFYEVAIDGKPLPKGEKPKMPLWWESYATWSYKKLTARTKITPIDHLMKPIFDSFLGLEATSGVFIDVLKKLGVDGDDLALMFRTINAAPDIDPDDLVEAFTRIQSAADRYSDNLFDEKVRPLVFYMGATGLLPDELDSPALTAEVMKERYPDLKIGNPQAESTFFVLDNGAVLSVTAVQKWYSVDAKARESQAIA